MKKIIRLTESQLTNLVTKVIKEQEEKIYDKCIEEIKRMGFSKKERSSGEIYAIFYEDNRVMGGKIKKEFSIAISFEERFGGVITISTTDLTPDPTGERKRQLHPETEYIYKVARQIGVKGRKEYESYVYEFSLNNCENPNPKLGSTAFLKEIVPAFESKFPNYTRI